jgi:hypothetical protein
MLDLFPLSELTDLEELDVAFCAGISDIPALYGLTKLRCFLYSEDSIPVEELLKLSRQIPDCDLRQIKSGSDEADYFDHGH